MPRRRKKGEKREAMQEAAATVLGQLTFPQLALPGKFDFSNVNEWLKRLKRLERYRVASRLNKQSQEFQVNAFMYAARSNAKDILDMLSLTEEQKKSYKDMTDALMCYVKRNNV